MSRLLPKLAHWPEQNAAVSYYRLSSRELTDGLQMSIVLAEENHRRRKAAAWSMQPSESECSPLLWSA